MLLNTFLGKEYTDRGRIANFTYRDKEGKIYRGTEQEMLTLYKQQLYSFVSHKVVRHKALENVFERMKNSFSRAA